RHVTVALHPGAILGPYTIQAVAQPDAGAAVYSARDTDSGRTVSIAPIRESGGGGAKARERLLAGAAAAARVSHPNLAMLFDVAENEDGLFGIFEHVEGQTLRAFLRQRGVT